MRKIYGISWILLCSVASVQAQKIVRGVVRDKTSGLPGVTVAIKDTKIGVSTNSQGDFQLSSPRDTLVLLFSSVGYEIIEKKVIILQDTTTLAPVRMKEDCIIDLFYSKHAEISLLSGLHYTPLGGKIKLFYPYLIHAKKSSGSLWTEFSYQAGSNNYQRNATLALDDLFLDCDKDISIAVDYQGIKLGEQRFSYARYAAGVTYAGKVVSSEVPVYLAVGKLTYWSDGIATTKAGLEVGAARSLRINFSDDHTVGVQIILTGRVAWWQDYWQLRSNLETQFRKFSVTLDFNKLGQYSEINTRLGFKIERRYHAKKKS